VSNENVTDTTATASPDVSNTTQSVNVTTTEQQEDDYDNVSNEENKTDVENIQDNNKEQDLEEEFGRNVNGSDKATIVLGDPVTNSPVLHSGHFAMIFAATLVVLSVLCYIGLVAWRSHLDKRYGMRQRLVTEDDFYNNNDVRFFGL